MTAASKQGDPRWACREVQNSWESRTKMNSRKLLISLSLFVITAFTQSAFAASLEDDHPITHGLNWDGQTGGVLVPIAMPVPSPAGKFGKPAVKFNYWNGGPVLGNFYNVSITEGWGKRFEFGFTEQFNSAGGHPLSFLSYGSYSTFHGKFMIVPDSFKKKVSWLPDVAIGAVGRFGDKHGDWAVMSFLNQNPHWGTQPNGDFYVVATKLQRLKKNLYGGLVFGDKVSNAVADGLPGSAGNGVNATKQRWQGLMFGGAAFLVPGPAQSRILFAGEFTQEPHYIQPFGNLSSAKTSTAYGIRFYPHMEGYPLQIDVGVLLAAGQLIAPGKLALAPKGVDVDARSRVGFGITYHFNGKNPGL